MKDFDPRTHVGSIPSPCINVCTMNPQTGLCEGCLRTIDEIAQWSTATDEMKRAVWIEIERRAKDVDASGPPVASPPPRK